MMASFVCTFILSVYRCKLSVSKQPKIDSAEFEVFLLSTLQKVAFLLKAKKKKTIYHIFMTVIESYPTTHLRLGEFVNLERIFSL
jgi:hypothetical protein